MSESNSSDFFVGPEPELEIDLPDNIPQSSETPLSPTYSEYVRNKEAKNKDIESTE